MITLTYANFDKFIDAFAKVLHQSRIIVGTVEISESHCCDTTEQEMTGLLESQTIGLKFRSAERIGTEQFWDKVERTMKEMN